MSNTKTDLTRRQFLKGTAGLTVAAVTGLGLPSVVRDTTEAAKQTKSRVVLVRDANVFDDEGEIRRDVVEGMLDEAVTTLLETRSSDVAWKRLIKTDDIVGIKSNEWAHLSTPSEVEMALQERVIAASVPEKKIAIGDRGILHDPIFQESTALINVRPLRTHHWSGVGSCIKNYIQFVEHPWEYHDAYCSPLGSIWQQPLVKDKTRLNILLLFRPLFHGIGPHHYDRSYVWRYCGLLAGTDVVAVDTIGLRILMAKRREHFKEDRPLTPPAIHIAQADTEYHLGTSDPDKIELIKRGWDKDSLI